MPNHWRARRPDEPYLSAVKLLQRHGNKLLAFGAMRYAYCALRA
jgi:hypothetical protein